MKLTKKLITIGRGKLSSATILGGIANFVLKVEGKLIKKSMQETTSQLFGYETVGYCEDLWILPNGKLMRLEDEPLYERNK